MKKKIRICNCGEPYGPAGHPTGGCKPKKERATQIEVKPETGRGQQSLHLNTNLQVRTS